jgi:pyrroloquinoline quinone biosynthesis protein E
MSTPGPTLAPPMGLLMELTHRCPLKCFYCSNPLELERAGTELKTEDWLRVLDEAAALGVLQVHFSGGEPMVRKDLAALVRRAHDQQLYANIITSGVLLTDDAMRALTDAGVDHLQLSFQDSEQEAGDHIGGYAGGHARKLAAAERIKSAGLPLTLNFVIHHLNADRVAEMIALSERLGAERVEIAHTQYYGWGLLNRTGLLPTRQQLDHATWVVEAARVRLKGVMTIDYVVPDYFAKRPKACMAGWGRRFMNITPSGKVLPCHAAETLPGIRFPSVRTQSLAEIWAKSDAFQRFRCQAFALTGDASATDPACEKSSDHGLMALAVSQPRGLSPLVPRI